MRKIFKYKPFVILKIGGRFQIKKYIQIITNFKIILEIKIIFVFMLILCNVLQNYYLQIITCLRIYAMILSLILSV